MHIQQAICQLCWVYLGHLLISATPTVTYVQVDVSVECNVSFHAHCDSDSSPAKTGYS